MGADWRRIVGLCDHPLDRAVQAEAKTFQDRGLSASDYVHLWVDGDVLEVAAVWSTGRADRTDQ